MQSKHVIASVMLSAALVTANAGATERHHASRWEHFAARGGVAHGRSIRAAPEFGAGAAGSAAAVVMGGLMALSGYRKKRRLD